MKKNIVILGSTGSIGKQTLDIIRSNKDKFSVKLLSTNKNVNLIIKQAKIFKVKNIIIIDYKKFLIAKNKYKNLKINIFNSFDILDNKFNEKKIYYSMSALVGIDGLEPTLKLIKLSKKIAIVNKESLVCGWPLIKKKLKIHKTEFIPIDSEHFSMNSLIKNYKKNDIKNIFITASGGPFLKNSKLNKKKISVKDALKHPNWTMGKKISIDSSTMMNKVLEVIEAKNIFDINYNQIYILTHPMSYIHCLIELNNGLIKLVAHEADMKIPIYNSIYENEKILNLRKINLGILNNLELKEIDKDQFPLVKILNHMPKYSSLYETAIVTINDYFVELFITKKISYNQLLKYIQFHLYSKEIIMLKKIHVKNLKQILKIRQYIILKLNKFVYKPIS